MKRCIPLMALYVSSLVGNDLHAQDPVAYITDFSSSNSVYAVDTVTNSVIATINVSSTSEYPGIAITPDGAKVYVALDSGVVDVIDTRTNTVTASVSLPGAAFFFPAVTPDGSKVFVTNYSTTNNNIVVIDTITDTLITTIDVGSTSEFITYAKGKAFISIDNNSVAIVNAATNALITTTPVGAFPYGIKTTPNGEEVYVACLNAAAVNVLSATTNAVVATIDVGGEPLFTTFSALENRAYIVNFNSNDVSVIDLTSHAVVATVGVGGLPLFALSSPDGTKVYVVAADGSMSVIDTSSNAVIATIPLGNRCDNIAFVPDKTQLVAPLRNGGGVLIIDTTTNTVEATIPVPGADLFALTIFEGLQAPSAPMHLSAKARKDIFLTESDYFIVLNWTASPSSSVTSYKILRNGTQIGTVASTSPLTFQDHHRKKGKTYTYEVIAVNSSGDSSPATVTVKAG
ncbi:MAG: hypothetical protein HYX48_06620 [Chlamydiales bacterium]|nr:hypothetical protein [Chlamydiales bacterium]